MASLTQVSWNIHAWEPSLHLTSVSSKAVFLWLHWRLNACDRQNVTKSACASGAEKQAASCTSILLYILVVQFYGDFRNLMYIFGHILNSNHTKVKISMASFKYKDYFSRGVSIHFAKILRLNVSIFQNRLFRYKSTFQQESSSVSHSTKKGGGEERGRGGGRRRQAVSRENTRAF